MQRSYHRSAIRPVLIFRYHESKVNKVRAGTGRKLSQRFGRHITDYIESLFGIHKPQSHVFGRICISRYIPDRTFKQLSQDITGKARTTEIRDQKGRDSRHMRAGHGCSLISCILIP